MLRLKYFVLSLLFITLSAQADHGNSKKTTVSPMFELFNSGNVPSEGDESRLRRKSSSLVYRISTSGLEPNTPHTVWVVAYNNPQHCKSKPCTPADLQLSPGHNPDVRASMMIAGGGMSDENGKGRFVGEVFRTFYGIPVSDVVLGPGLLNTRRAEIYLVIRQHGQPANLEDLLAALSSYRGACNPENGVQPTPCSDIQASLHSPAE